MEAGLPNITGSMRFAGAGNAGFYSGESSGALSSTKIKTTTNQLYNLSNAGSDIKDTFTLNAKDSNSIYGNSDTVQPNSLTCRFYIKY